MKKLLLAVSVTVATCAPMLAVAENLAVIFANGFYDEHPVVRQNRTILGLERQFQNAGFTVELFNDSQSLAHANDYERLAGRLQRADRVAIILSGHIIHSDGQSYLLHTDALTPNSFTVGRDGLPIAPFLTLGATHPGAALVAIAHSGAGLTLGYGVGAGPVITDIPQGVTVASGSPSQIRSFMSALALDPGVPIADLAVLAPGVTVQGYVPRLHGFVPADPAPSGPSEFDVWDEAQRLNTAQAYGEYLRQYPNGSFAAEARQRINALNISPQDRAREAEAALNLTRTQRRRIQEWLNILGFNVGSADGLLGRRSRTAIANWQNSIGDPPYGYLSANQLTRLELAATRRAEELRQEQERQDRDYWSRVGANGTENGLRAYLNRFPNGIFASEARRQLDEIERQQQLVAEQQDRDAWGYATSQNTLEAYQTYAQDYPNGLFISEAKHRISQLSQPQIPPNVLVQAERQEQGLNLNAFTRQLIEGQLKKKNFDPGRVDGQFTAQTREAIKGFQGSVGQPQTGFVTRGTVALLLATSLGGN